MTAFGFIEVLVINKFLIVSSPFSEILLIWVSSILMYARLVSLALRLSNLLNVRKNKIKTSKSFFLEKILEKFTLFLIAIIISISKIKIASIIFSIVDDKSLVFLKV